MAARKIEPEKPQALCVGVNPAFDMTVTLDGLDDDRVNRVTGEHCQAAGKAANVACGLSSEGVETILTGFFGRDNFDGWRELFSRRLGGTARLRPVLCEGSIRRNTTLLTGGRTLKINYPGCAVDDSARERLLRLVADASGEGQTAIFTGSLPPGMGSGDYLRLMKAAGDAGSRVVIDTDRLTAGEILSVRPWIYKPNAHELAAVCGIDARDDDQLIRSAGRLAADGVEIVLLTLGSRGLVAVTAERTIRIAPRKVEAVNTVGAGDAALAAFIAAALRDEALELCAQRAVQAGERAVTQLY